MEFSTHVKPVSYIKTHADALVREVAETGNPLIVTLNGEAKVVMISVREYDKARASLAMLKMLALSSLEMKEGKMRDADEVFGSFAAMLEEKKCRKMTEKSPC